jgi:hypothetical protein
VILDSVTKVEFATIRRVPGKSGGLNGSMQHQLDIQFAGG